MEPLKTTKSWREYRYIFFIIVTASVLIIPWVKIKIATFFY